MKAHKNIELYDRIDIIISRGLKNLALSSAPRAGEREQLLKLASLPPTQYPLRKTDLLAILREHLFNTDLEIPPKGEWSDGFRTKHMTLALCFSTSWRMGI